MAGVLGGGQLGRMFCMAAQTLGYRVCVLDPAPDSVAGAVAEKQILADYTDPAALAELATLCRAVTTEFENVPAQSLERLARDCAVSRMPSRWQSHRIGCGKRVSPSSAVWRWRRTMPSPRRPTWIGSMHRCCPAF